MFDSLRDRKFNRKDDASANASQDNPEEPDTMEKSMREEIIGRQSKPTRPPALATPKSGPTIADQLKRVSQFATQPATDGPRMTATASSAPTR